MAKFRAMRWFKSLFGMKKQTEQKEPPNFSVFCQDPATIPPNITAAEAAWLRSFTEKEQNRQAVAIAVATTMAADAAVAAAQAAVAVVRLTSHGRGSVLSRNSSQSLAAVKIQTNFRGYLARKALKALKGLVKLQALVRGFLVRKEANETLRRIEALIRSQNIVRAKKAHCHRKNNGRFLPNFHVQKLAESYDDKAPIHSRRISSSFDAKMNSFDEKRMMDEADLARPKSRYQWLNNSISSSSEDLFCSVHCQKPVPLSTPDSGNSQDTSWALTQNDCMFSSVQSTPRFANGPNPYANGPSTPAKSVSGTNIFLRSYMADTQSFKAKQRSQSAPKQRSDIGPKRVSLNELMESRNSHSGVRLSCSQAQDVITFKNVVMGKLERSCDFASHRQDM